MVHGDIQVWRPPRSPQRQHDIHLICGVGHLRVTGDAKPLRALGRDLKLVRPRQRDTQHKPVRAPCYAAWNVGTAARQRNRRDGQRRREWPTAARRSLVRFGPASRALLGHPSSEAIFQMANRDLPVERVSSQQQQGYGEQNNPQLPPAPHLASPRIARRL